MNENSGDKSNSGTLVSIIFSIYHFGISWLCHFPTDYLYMSLNLRDPAVFLSTSHSLINKIKLVKERDFQCLFFVFDKLPRPNSTARAPFLLQQGEGKVLSWLHDLPLMQSEKHLCMSLLCLCLFFHRQTCLLLQLSFIPLTWEGSVLGITLESDPPRFFKRVFIPLRVLRQSRLWC